MKLKQEGAFGSMYLLDLKHVFLQSVAIAIVTAALIISYMEWVSMRNLPDVVVGTDNKCIKVVNYSNGDAYQCQDVDVVLRKYKRVVQNG